MSTDIGPRKALGRGLAALIPDAGRPAPAEGGGLRHLPVERVHPNRSQPRKTFDGEALDELAASIREQGILQPIVVRRHGEQYEIVAGERRWRAATRAGHQTIPALIKELTDVDALQVALVENLQRRDLDPLEEAEAYTRLVREHGMTQEQVAQAVGKSRVAVTNTMRLLKLPEAVLGMLADGRLTSGHARALMTLDSDEDRVKLAEDAVRRKSTVRDVERKARMMKLSAKKAKKGIPRPTPAELAVEERLMRALSTKCRLHNRGGKGRIEIFFHSLEQLDSILDRIER